MNMEECINEAITHHLSVLYNLASIKAKFGEEVSQAVDEIASFATNDAIWAADDDEMSHKETQDRLSIKFQFLTEASRIKISDVAAYFWK